MKNEIKKNGAGRLKHQLEVLHKCLSVIPTARYTGIHTTESEYEILRNADNAKAIISDMLDDIDFTDLTVRIEEMVGHKYGNAAHLANDNAGRSLESLYLRRRDAFKEVLDIIKKLKEENA